MKLGRRNFLLGAAVAATAATFPKIESIGETQPHSASADANDIDSVDIVVDDIVRHTMAGGMGASWHAIGPTGYFYQGAVRGDGNQRRIRGSGWGGTPLADDEQQWQDMCQHFRWLGLDFVRVEIDMRMYAPERGKFNWQNDEMKMLYRILDICQENHADVFFTQMWQDVEWNAIAGVNRIRSAPKSDVDFAICLGTLMQHLIQNKQYSCIRWLCIANEPANDWGWWLGADQKPQDLMPAVRAVRAELDHRGLSSLTISGPDYIDSDNFNSPRFDWNDPAVGAFDYHYYSSTAPVSMDWIHPLIVRARTRGVPIFISEMGSYVGGDPDKDPCMAACADYGNQLMNAEKVLLGLNLGVDGFNRWSFTNRGDLDGQWQLVETWDPVHWNYLPRVEPVPVPYYTYGILTRFMAKHSRVLEIKAGNDGVLAAAVLSKSENATVLVLNKSDREQKINLRLSANFGKPVFHKYQVTQATVESPGFELSPIGTFSATGDKKNVQDNLPMKSITVYSNYHLLHTDSGIVNT